MQLQELNNRFSKVNIELPLCTICLNPSDSFVTFDLKKKEVDLPCKRYPYDFSWDRFFSTWWSTSKLHFWYALRVIVFIAWRNLCSCSQVSGDKEAWHISITLFACEVSFNSSSCDCNNRKKFFSNEIYREWIAQSNRRSVDEWLLSCVHWKRHNIYNEIIMQQFQNIKTCRKKL